jgi:hypothetical protein
MKRQFNRNLILFIIVLIILVIPGCANIMPSKPTATATVTSTPRPPRKTRTPSATPTATSTLTATPTITATATLPPPPDDFSQAHLYSSGTGPGWEFFFTIELREKIVGEYSAVVGDPEKEFTCRPLAEYSHPERLYCTGRIPKVDENLLFKIIETKTGQTVYKGYVFSPLP